MVDLRGVQELMIRITHINEGTGRAGIKGTIDEKMCRLPTCRIFKNGRNLSRKDDLEGEASYLKLNLPLCQNQCTPNYHHYEKLRIDRLPV